MSDRSKSQSSAGNFVTVFEKVHSFYLAPSGAPGELRAECFWLQSFFLKTCFSCFSLSLWQGVPSAQSERSQCRATIRHEGVEEGHNNTEGQDSRAHTHRETGSGTHQAVTVPRYPPLRLPDGHQAAPHSRSGSLSLSVSLSLPLSPLLSLLVLSFTQSCHFTRKT